MVRVPASLLALACAALAGPSAAQEATPTDVESIEVTGERLDVTDVQDEAQAISAFSAEDLDRANIVNVDSLAFNVPGLHVGQAGQAAIITLRGIGTENASLTGEPGVAFHLDGIYLGRPSAARVAFFDLDSLDVKRGPQGLLGGKNSTSGSINLTSKKPHGEYEVDGDVLFGNLNRVRLRGAVNLPLSEYVSTRLALFHEDRDGYLDNKRLSSSRDPFDADDFGLRAHLRLTPSDSLDVLLSYNYFKQTGNGPQADIVPVPDADPGCSGPAASVSFTVMPVIAACFIRVVEPQRIEIGPGGARIIPPVLALDPATEDTEPRDIYLDVPSAQDNRYWGWSSTIDWDVPRLRGLGETRMQAIAGFYRTENGFIQDFDATDRRIVDFDLESFSSQYSGELRWSGQLAERLDWQAGGFFARESAARHVQLPGLVDPDSFVTSDQTTDNKSYGASLHGTLHLTSDVRLQLGARWIKDRKRTRLLREISADDNLRRFRGCTGFLNSLNDASGRKVPARHNDDCSRRDRNVAWGTGLDWRPFGGEHLLYARIDRGAKSGGFRAGTIGEYEPEKIWAYALGTKSELFDRRLQLNIEGFFYAYEDMQLVVLDGLALRTENTDARMYGVDLEALAMPLPGLELSAVVSYLHTETIDYFSLEPAAAKDEFQKRRLEEREEVEANLAEGVSTTTFAESVGCFPTPDGGTLVPCGRLGDRDGLDDFSGNDLSRSPEWKITLAAEYEIPLGSWGSLTPRIQYMWQDDTYFRAFNQDFDLQEAYHLTDVKLTWRSPEQRWLVEVFAQNLEDEAPKQNILIAPREFGSPPLAWYGPPRFFGVRVGFTY